MRRAARGRNSGSSMAGTPPGVTVSSKRSSVAPSRSSKMASQPPATGSVVTAAIRTGGSKAVISIVYSVRRFWRADHSKRWHYTVFGFTIIGFLVYLTVTDLADLLS